MLCKFIKYLVLGLLAFGTYHVFKCCGNSSKINFEEYHQDGWFGVKKLKIGEKIPADPVEIKPFTVNVPDSVLVDLKNRLANARFADHIEGTEFTYGFNSDYLKQVVEYWRTKYDWRKEERKLNAFPQFVTKIEGLDIHFVHVKPSKPAKTVVPLLMSHGWPGSVWEHYKMIPLLTEPVNGVAFEVVAPSIPGYGFSEAPHQPGFNSIATARIFAKLMKRLGHEKYFAHGGDWGNFITRLTGTLYPENTRGIHLIANMATPRSANGIIRMLLASTVPSLFFGKDTAEKEYSKMFPFGEKFLFLLRESGYMHIQSTKPDTVGAALVDSPVGLAAYILEKFSTWTNHKNIDKTDGGLTTRFTLDELLTNVMIYWTSGNIASSQRYYKENVVLFHAPVASAIVKVPTATVDTPWELARMPRKIVESLYDNLLQYSEFDQGGHFTGFEVPDLVAKDIRAFANKVFTFEKEQEQIKKQNQKKKDEI